MAIAVTLGLGSGADRAEAYLFYDNGALDYIVGSDRALRWSEEAWGPGPGGRVRNADGAFLIEGLPAGDYVLWALPIRLHWKHWRLIEEDAATDVKDAVLAHPVRVEAGRTTEGIMIPMRRGRR